MMAPLNASLFNAEEGIREGRQKAFESIGQNPAFTGRLEYHGLPGLSLGGSFWTGKSGFATPGINPRVNVFEFDGRFSVSRFDFRGEWANVNLDQTSRLNSLLQRTSGVNPNIAERMRGFYVEGAYHLLPLRQRYDLVAFSRYENFDTQHRMARGFLPLKEFDRDALVTGLTFFPEPDVALKFDYTVLRNPEPAHQGPKLAKPGNRVVVLMMAKRQAIAFLFLIVFCLLIVPSAEVDATAGGEKPDPCHQHCGRAIQLRAVGHRPEAG